MCEASLVKRKVQQSERMCEHSTKEELKLVKGGLDLPQEMRSRGAEELRSRGSVQAPQVSLSSTMMESFL